MVSTECCMQLINSIPENNDVLNVGKFYLNKRNFVFSTPYSSSLFF